MRNDLVEVRSSVPVRKFVPVYHDMLRADIKCEEKLIYIILKSFMSFGCEEGEVYPSMDTICAMSGMSRPRATRAINKLVKNGYVKKLRRGVTKPNLYTIADYPAMWQEQTTVEERKEILDAEIPYTTDQLINELVRRGVLTEEKFADVGKKNGSVSAATENDPDGDGGRLNTTSICNNTTHFSGDSQEYTINYIHGIYEYDILTQRQEHGTEDLDAVMDILYDALNTKKQTIRIGGEEWPTEVVKNKLLKLGTEDIEYAIEKYHGVTGRIKNPRSYILTILYRAKEQGHLDVVNEVNHDLHGSTPEKNKQPERGYKNSFCDFEQNEYNEDELERELLVTSGSFQVYRD